MHGRRACRCFSSTGPIVPTAATWKPAAILAGRPGGKPGAWQHRPRFAGDAAGGHTAGRGLRGAEAPGSHAFFHTELDLILRRLGVRTLYLTGTTTPNCIRTTCYDGLSLDSNVGILTDCCSSNRGEIQQANMVDMANIGATLMTCAAFCDGKQATDWTDLVQAELL